MKSGICPKCNQPSVYHHAGSKYLPGELVALTDSAWRSKGTVPDKYVCVACGYLEYYVTVPESLTLIQEKWEKVRYP